MDISTIPFYIRVGLSVEWQLTKISGKIVSPNSKPISTMPASLDYIPCAPCRSAIKGVQITEELLLSIQKLTEVSKYHN